MGLIKSDEENDANQTPVMYLLTTGLLHGFYD